MSGAQTVLTSWAEAGDVLRVGVAPARPAEAEGDPVEEIAKTLAGPPLAAIFLFVSPEADAEAVARRACARFAPVPVIGCTTAGEISPDGYVEGRILAIGLPADLFAVEKRLVPDLDDLAGESLISDMIRARQTLARTRPDWEGEFAFVMVDGLSRREDELTAALAAALGPVPLFGGSAGDGLRFGNTFVFHEGRALQKAAVITFVRSRCRVKVFNLDHLVPTDQRMVVTGADPARRIVHTINAEPAAFEYARLLGKDPAQLTTFTFAAHPVVVRFGGRHHVRSIQRMEANGDLHFFSAIGEGLVLTLAEPQDMADHLARELDALAQGEPPAAILACDCVLRRIEAQEKQAFGRLSDLLRRHRVVGFSTYGEQLGAMHVNQTMTGVAIYPPEEGAR
ncbi:FIST N-terminal domain-containing protein [Frigidibacter sp. SD6-1]|uniref:FIST N-terminal domain-containing protein n=1 Tax=Frigidibacter sp. SD6-1 TaxID=3032581 RepID=UPI0024DFF36E|nr:FIST N-terminal domain-containing protein [Frigidibacter sp. SD6-1]